MSVNQRFTAFSLLFTLALMAIPAVSQGRRGGSVTPVPVNPPAMITVEGVVSAVDLQYGSGYPSFELTAGSVTYTIFMGPLRFVDGNDFELSVGDRLNAVILAAESAPTLQALQVRQRGCPGGNSASLVLSAIKTADRELHSWILASGTPAANL
jgi:hypothetical protein